MLGVAAGDSAVLMASHRANTLVADQSDSLSADGEARCAAFNNLAAVLGWIAYPDDVCH